MSTIFYTLLKFAQVFLQSAPNSHSYCSCLNIDSFSLEVPQLWVKYYIVWFSYLAWVHSKAIEKWYFPCQKVWVSWVWGGKKLRCFGQVVRDYNKLCLFYFIYLFFKLCLFKAMNWHLWWETMLQWVVICLQKKEVNVKDIWPQEKKLTVKCSRMTEKLWLLDTFKYSF